MSDAFEITLVPNHLGKHLAAQGRAVKPQLRVVVAALVNQGVTDIADETSVGWSGQLRRGYSGRTTVGASGVRGVITNPVPYHDAVEDGRRPGAPPPTSALIPWVGSKLGIPPGRERESVAFLVARAIGRRGTRPQNMVAKGIKRTMAGARPALRKAGLRIVSTRG